METFSVAHSWRNVSGVIFVFKNTTCVSVIVVQMGNFRLSWHSWSCTNLVVNDDCHFNFPIFGWSHVASRLQSVHCRTLFNSIDLIWQRHDSAIREWRLYYRKVAVVKIKLLVRQYWALRFINFPNVGYSATVFSYALHCLPVWFRTGQNLAST